MNYLFSILTSLNRYNIISIDGKYDMNASSKGKKFQTERSKEHNHKIVKALFSPKSNGNFVGEYNSEIYKISKQKNINYDILIATDKFAEGHNLQDATVVINYDLS